MEQFTFFWSGPFSNWHPSKFEVDGVKYNCSEQFMMAEKARLFNDQDTLAKILASSNPKDQKACGRLVQKFNKDKWEAVARDVVYKGCLAKFSQNPDLKEALLATVGTSMVEASPYDRIWGIGLAKDDPRAKDRSKWRGTNWLGETLDRVREELLKTKE